MATNSRAKSQTEDDLAAEVTVTATPTAVWSRLVAFDEYAEWGAPIRIEGDAHAGGPVVYSVRARFVGAGDHWTTFPGRITVLEPGAQLRMQVGSRFWLRVDLAFVLQTARNGTRVQHSARLSGPLSILGGRRLRKVFATAVHGTAAALAKTGSASPSPAPTDWANRKARRKQRAKRS